MADRDRNDFGAPENARPRDRTGRPLPYGTDQTDLAEDWDVATVEEALQLADAAGIDEKQMIEIASVSTGESWALHGYGPMRDLLRSRGISSGIALIAGKDVRLAVEMAKGIGVETPIAEFVVALGRGERSGPAGGGV